jgi:RND family efflux transporter MFP subunit
LSSLQVTKTGDPLASLRIDASQRARSGPGWMGVLVVVVVVALLGAVGGYVWVQYGAPLFRIEVRTATAEVRVPGVTDSIHKAQGYIKSRHQAAIGAKVPGRILKLNVEEGQRVEKDEVLAELEHADIDASIEAMRAALEKARAEVHETEIMTEQDERDYRRTARLYESRGASGSEYERAESKLKGTRSRLMSQRAALDLAEANLHNMEQQRENLIVRSPFAGTVISKESEVGETIALGGMGANSASGRGSVVTLADLEHLEVEADVKEDFVNLVRPGQPATVAVDAVPGRLYTGRVRTIIPMGDRARGTIKVKVEVVDADERLFPEMAATVNFLNEPRETVANPEKQVFAPADAVQRDASGAFVWRVVHERVDRVAVQVGEPREGNVLIRSGLKGNEELVLNPPDSLKPDQPVRIAR